MRKLKIEVINLIDMNDETEILCSCAIGQRNKESEEIVCDTRCAKFRIAELDTINSKLMPKNTPMFCYCGTDRIGELIKEIR